MEIVPLGVQFSRLQLAQQAQQGARFFSSLRPNCTFTSLKQTLPHLHWPQSRLGWREGVAAGFECGGGALWGLHGSQAQCRRSSSPRWVAGGGAEPSPAPLF